ncbi:hypothetical protein [Magnetospirillum sp. 15-1]|uniref:hypothetical protein n=1 Tax=Magnetospirillum sp. 15-1 TaxID=1979370 RepID=UPI000BBC0898|nr:hypothetical protein [Magnetospirillum sp. 15-1]
MMTALLAVTALTLFCLGAGAAALRAAGLLGRLGRAEGLGWSFALGFGLLGWLIFWLALLGWLQPWAIAACCVLALPGLLALRDGKAERGAWSWRAWIVLAVLALIMALDGLEALAPPADADSLAYHFALPRRILDAGHLLFIERALDSASPQLVQMTYLAALALGGEQALTLWCMVSGWGIGLLTYGLARRHLPLDWSLALAAVVLSLPAMLYAGGTGQVEPRTAMFVLVAVVAAIEARTPGALAPALVAGLACGFLVASKYTGLLPAFVCGVAVLSGRNGIRGALVFGVALLLMGGQWYGWNAWNTGDPVFPLLYGRIAYTPQTAWNGAQAAYMAASLSPMELGVPRSAFWLLAYPVVATLQGHPVFESGRTGFGLLGLLLLPLAVAAAWRRRERLAGHPLTATALVILVTYGLWFFLGPSQRVRHLLPLLPPLLVALLAAARSAARHWRFGASLWLGMAVVLALQLAGAGVFSVKFARYLAQGRDRDAFLAANVNFYALAQWLNTHMGPDDRVLLPVREIDYLVRVPMLQANPYIQSEVEIRPDSTDPRRFLAQLRAHGITRVVAGPQSSFGSGAEVPDLLSWQLVEMGCAAPPRRW